MKTLNMLYLVIYWTQKVHNNFIFLCNLHFVPSATLQTMSIIVVNLQDNRAVFQIFYRTFKVFIWFSLLLSLASDWGRTVSFYVFFITDMS